MKIKPESFNSKDAYFFAISLIIPRPIAFITTRSENDVVNAAPFSYFNGISTKPFLFTVSIANKKDKKKDTQINIIKTKEFCVNFVDEQMAEGVTISAAEFPSDISEMKYNQFTLEDSDLISAPRIKNSKASMECRLVRTIDDLGPFSLIIAEAILFHVDDEIIDESTGYIDANKANFLGRLGGADFCTLGNTKTIPRKNWQDFMPK